MTSPREAIGREPKMNPRPNVSDLDATEAGLRARLEWWGADADALAAGTTRVVNAAVEPCHVALALIERVRAAEANLAAIREAHKSVADARAAFAVGGYESKHETSSERDARLGDAVETAEEALRNTLRSAPALASIRASAWRDAAKEAVKMSTEGGWRDTSCPHAGPEAEACASWLRSLADEAERTKP